MPHATPLPELPDAFAATTAYALGLTRAQLRRAGITTPRSGVRRMQHPPPAGETPWERREREHLERIGDEVARLPAGAAISHVSAAVLHGLPLRMLRIGDDVHVTAPSDESRRRRKGTVVHPLPRDAAGFVRPFGFAVTDPVTTWCALAATVSVDELIAIGDALVCRQNPVATLEDLHAAVRHHGQRWGVKRLRDALLQVRARTDSPRETELRLILVRGGLPEPDVNASTRGYGGRHVKWGDLVHPDYRVLTEYDGEQHRTDSAQYAKDAADIEELVASGWRVVRVRKGDMHDPAAIVARVRNALRAQGYPAITDGSGRS
ncbi:endonuclease domain-containing protein [Microbacterium sp. NPDC091313]